MIGSIFNYMKQIIQPSRAADEVIVTAPDSCRGGHRVSTPVWGTAPAMFGKGPPSHLVGVDDALRPQTTKVFNKHYNAHSYDFPNLHITAPVKVQGWNPVSTRGYEFRF